MLLIPLLAVIQKGAFLFATLLKYVKIVRVIIFALYTHARLFPLPQKAIVFTQVVI